MRWKVCGDERRSLVGASASSGWGAQKVALLAVERSLSIGCTVRPVTLSPDHSCMHQLPFRLVYTDLGVEVATSWLLFFVLQRGLQRWVAKAIFRLGWPFFAISLGPDWDGVLREK